MDAKPAQLVIHNNFASGVALSCFSDKRVSTTPPGIPVWVCEHRKSTKQRPTSPKSCQCLKHHSLLAFWDLEPDNFARMSIGKFSVKFSSWFQTRVFCGKIGRKTSCKTSCQTSCLEDDPPCKNFLPVTRPSAQCFFSASCCPISCWHGSWRFLVLSIV